MSIVEHTRHITAGRWPGAVAALVALLLALPATALETDQYYAWGRSISDGADVVNAKFNLELELAANEVNSHPARTTTACGEVVKQLHSQLHFTTFQEIELWALKTDMLSRVPADPKEELEYRKENLYQTNGPFDPSSWLPTVPTIEVDGIRFGTDKLAHFVSSGYRWHEGYLKALADGLTPAQAERHVIEVGLFWERTMLGGIASGATSLADLEANYQGMRFYYGLCHGPEPNLVLRDGAWVVQRPFDIRDHVGPEWDESYNPPIYSDRRWRKVRPVLESYCDRLALPSVQAQRQYYRSIDNTTAVEAAVADMVAQGDMPDPHQYSIEASCPPVAVSTDPSPNEPPRPTRESTADTTGRELRRELYRRATEVHRRTAGVVSAMLTNPERLAVSLGLLFTQGAPWYDCTTVCSFSGPMIQLGAGIGGGRLSAGWGRVIGDQRAGAFLVTDPYIGLAFKGTLLHTWGNPWREPAGATFAGGEVEFTIARVNLGAGIFYHLGGAEPDHPWLVSARIGWGF